jgi:hypothetical protein
VPLGLFISLQAGHRQIPTIGFVMQEMGTLQGLPVMSGEVIDIPNYFSQDDT